MTAIRRLMYDLRELDESPVAFATARPISTDDMLLWHGNFVSPKKGHPFHDCSLHFELAFSKEYPSVPPSVKLFSPLPHSNVLRTLGGYKICLDMLETGVYADPGHAASGTFPYSGWSSAYTVKSILLQLQSFLLDKKLDDAINSGSGLVMQSKRQAINFECQTSGCLHKPGNPWPLALDWQEKRAPIYVERPFVKDLLEVAAAKKVLEERALLAEANAKAFEVDADGFSPTKKGVKVDGKAGLVGMAAVPLNESSPYAMLFEEEVGSNKVLEKAVAPSAEPVAVASAQVATTTAVIKPKAVVSSPKASATPVLTKSALKNKKRNEKRKRKAHCLDSSVSDIDVEIEEQKEEPVVEVVMEDLVPDETTSIGLFSKLPYDVVLEILNLLPVSSIMTLSQSCKFFNTATEDGFLWKHLYQSLDAKVAMKGATLGDWKHVYRIQMMGVVEDLRCFHRKISFKEDVLGVPIEFTVNPVKKTIDYMHSTMDLLSHSAFREDQVRKTVWSESFSEWLPLYISYDHFLKGLPLLKKSFVRLTPHIKSRGFDPVMVLEVLPKLMNTQIVLLCDQGLHNSDSFLTNYFQIHRLFLALVYEFPQLKNLILKRLTEFAKSPNARTKAIVPSLGDLIPLMAVLPDPMKVWKNVGPLFLKESMERSVLWACRHAPHLAKLKNIPHGTVEPERIKDTFDGSATSMKLWAAHVSIFEAISSYGSTTKLAKTHDLFYGRPTTKFLSSLKQSVTAVLGCDSFETIFPFYHLPQLPFMKPTFSPSKLTQALRECVQQSLKKGYHSKTTNFSKIHASGVSKILRKGQSYRCAPGIKSIVMEESWGVGGASTFLDATCLAYNFKGEFMDLADYAHTNIQGGAIRHSGDVMNGDRGSHKITIDTKKLPEIVKTLVFTMTSWTARLCDMKDPEVRLFDGESMTELCQYGFDECAKAGQNTCVVMCTLGREAVGGIWKVVAVGKIGMGTAMNYEPVKEMILGLRVL
ncbi:UNVERIFIED_CONTAM: hypothetical protein HDU68_011987 [Siphonaria sp. JEL0065]|nr:hypothetical protein HDU68_011987 [Siphonaria sp. JEL0065]